MLEEFLLGLIITAAYRDRYPETHTGRIDRYMWNCTDDDWHAFLAHRSTLMLQISWH